MLRRRRLNSSLSPKSPKLLIVKPGSNPEHVTQALGPKSLRSGVLLLHRTNHITNCPCRRWHQQRRILARQGLTQVARSARKYSKVLFTPAVFIALRKWSGLRILPPLSLPYSDTCTHYKPGQGEIPRAYSSEICSNKKLMMLRGLQNLKHCALCKSLAPRS